MLLRSALISALLPCVVFAAERPRVVVVKSSSLTAYAQVIAGFAAEVKGQVEEITLEDGPDAAAAAFKKSPATNLRSCSPSGRRPP